MKNNEFVKKSFTKIISAYPCTGKTTLCKKNEHKYLDLEFRETVTSKGMDNSQLDTLFHHYASIVNLVYQTGAYEYIFVTDNEYMLKHLSLLNLPFTYIVPDPNDEKFLQEHYYRVLNRNNKVWYDNIIVPRNEKLKTHIHWVANELHREVRFLTTEYNYVSKFLNKKG